MPTALAIMSHPDDIELLCAGTLILLKQANWTVHLATMTPGDLGSMNLKRPEISEVRRAEAAASAKVIGAGYTCLEFADLCIECNSASKRRVSGLIRQVRPDLLITHAPVDYMMDHEQTALIAREAAFSSTVPNWEPEFISGEPAPPCAHLPAILYADPIENIDHKGIRTPAQQVVDISGVIETKERMLAAHASQRDWLRQQHGEDEYILSMKRWCADRARDFGNPTVKFAEGFNQHFGHGFPKTDFLTQALGSKARVL